jgi:hypothetical protein
MWICFVSLPHVSVQAVALATAFPSCHPVEKKKA